MKDFYIRDCQQHENQTMTSNFVVASKQVKTKKNGEPIPCPRAGRPYWAGTGEHVGQRCRGAEQLRAGRLRQGQGHGAEVQRALAADRPQRSASWRTTEIDHADYLPKTSKDIDQLWRTLGEFVESFQNPWLKRLVQGLHGR